LACKRSDMPGLCNLPVPSTAAVRMRTIKLRVRIRVSALDNLSPHFPSPHFPPRMLRLVAFTSNKWDNQVRLKTVSDTLPAHTLPTQTEAKQAEETSRVLSSRLRSKAPLRLRVVGAPKDETLVIPASAVKMLVGILDEMGRGNTVTVIPVHAELTTQEAADMLSISRPSLIQLLDEGKMEFRKIGTHRRVRFESVIAYKRRVHAEGLAALNELAAYDQEIGI
jgi:excisionase family DNA binding protein